MADWTAFAVANAPAILDGLIVTAELTVCAAALGVSLGVLLAAGRGAGPRWGAVLIDGYVEIMRDTPFIVQLFFIFFGLPSLGLRFSAFPAAVLALSLNLGAYATEIVRAGLQAVPPGQGEAGRSLGLRRPVVFGLLVLPQAIGKVFPALASQIVITMLDSAVVSQIALRDLTFEADLIQSRTFLAFETYLVTTALYLGLSVLLRWTLGLGGRRVLRGAT